MSKLNLGFYPKRPNAKALGLLLFKSSILKYRLIQTKFELHWSVKNRMMSMLSISISISIA